MEKLLAVVMFSSCLFISGYTIVVMNNSYAVIQTVVSQFIK